MFPMVGRLWTFICLFNPKASMTDYEIWLAYQLMNFKVRLILALILSPFFMFLTILKWQNKKKKT